MCQVQSYIRFYVDCDCQYALNGWADLLRKYPNDTYALGDYGYAALAIGRSDLAHRAFDRAALRKAGLK